MKSKWSVLIALIVVAGISLWAANSQRTNAIDTNNMQEVSDTTVNNTSNTSGQTQIAFIVVLGIIFSALFYVHNTPDHQPTRATRKILIKR